MSTRPFRLSNVATFHGLSGQDLTLLEAELQPIDVGRGQCIVTEGDDADALFVVVSGRFGVEIDGTTERITEIGQGATIGEIAFFAGGTRTATVRAIRDSVVVRLSRKDFDRISGRAPEIWKTITATLATRLAAETRKAAKVAATGRQPRNMPRPRTIALIHAGAQWISPAFIAALSDVARRDPTTLVATSKTIADVTGQNGADVTAAALNELEMRYATILFVADDQLTRWTENVIRQADALVSVGAHPDGPLGSPVALNAVERFAATLHRPDAHRLAIVHSKRASLQGTRHWLAARTPAMHHHVALADQASIARLWRFIVGNAWGFVACGGGAYCAAHIGVYRAFRESGTTIDYYGGTSGGAAMAAAFAQDLEPREIDARVHRMFIEGRALAHYTLPRYSLLDQAHFDAHLQTEYGNVRIEDMWIPYFAVSADLASATLEVHRDGPVWQAIRASAAIPGLLPPYTSADGRLLVDGSVIANVPIEVMHALKSGPNIVVSFDPPGGEPIRFNYEELPARRDLLWRTLNPFKRASLPSAPSAGTVLVRSLMANRGHFESHLTDEDWLLVPPTPNDMGALDWRRHSALAEAAYHYTLAEIDGRQR
jgi:NTE family protein